MPRSVPDADFESAIASISVDRASPVPLYYQLARGLERAITEGRLPPGSRLDNEMLIAERLNLSRPTVRQAMQHLVDQGLVVRRRGVGTRVVQPKVRRPLELTSLYDDLREGGQAPTTHVLSLDTVEATDELAAIFGVPAGDALVRTERLRSAAGRPIAKLTNYLPTDLVELTVEGLEREGLYALMRARGIHMHMATQIVGARCATAPESRLLDESPGAALLTMQRTSFDDHGRVVEYGSHIYAASRYAFETSLLSP